ncbi:hypothetical protein [Streptomyces liangshanensis]|uniref:hypothetical protein n=1 Tax=Streptomyces liangshanensis TaxID=2717324 RepID=UPI001FBA5D21|nr:hypothetical protein [Streptomyces liangshanensis]
MSCYSRPPAWPAQNRPHTATPGSSPPPQPHTTNHFRTPPSVEDIEEGRVQTVLSGRSLIALLIELWNTRSTATPLQGDWALATTSYNRIATELADVDGQGDTIRIVLDDGLPPRTDD